jgi:mono/diheme cytochrome c family protein
MKKFLRWVTMAAGGLFVLLAIAGAVVYGWSEARIARRYAVNARPVEVPADPESIARGRHVALTRGCLDCHGADLGGDRIVENAAIGRWYGPNLTRGAGGLPVTYGNIDYVRAIRHGLDAGNQPLMLMPSHEFAHFSDRDMGDLIAYLKSVPPVDRERVPIAVGPLARVLILAGEFAIPAERIDHANVRPAVVSPGATLEYGRYLAVGCQGCHGATYAGGKIPGTPPDWPPASNLTPDPSSRSTHWTEADFLNAMRTGVRPDGSAINKVMPWEGIGKMTDDELKAIWMYLRSLPPEKGK